MRKQKIKKRKEKRRKTKQNDKTLYKTSSVIFLL